MAELDEELRRKNEYEARIRELESKESELIEVLQSTNAEEMQALEGLKQVLNGDTSEIMDESFTSSAEKRDSELRGNDGAKEVFRYI